MKKQSKVNVTRWHEKMQKKMRREKVETILRFINKDIDSLPKEDLHRVSDEILNLMMPRRDESTRRLSRSNMKEIQNEGRKRLDHLMRLFAKGKKAKYPRRLFSATFWFVQISAKEFATWPEPYKRPTSTAFLNFLMGVLGAKDITNVKRCARVGCRKYFFQFTQRPKTYCSNSCAWIVNAEEARRKDREKVNKYKRTSYAKKQKEKSGGKVTPRRPSASV